MWHFKEDNVTPTPSSVRQRNSTISPLTLRRRKQIPMDGLCKSDEEAPLRAEDASRRSHKLRSLDETHPRVKSHSTSEPGRALRTILGLDRTLGKHMERKSTARRVEQIAARQELPHEGQDVSTPVLQLRTDLARLITMFARSRWVARRAPCKVVFTQCIGEMNGINASRWVMGSKESVVVERSVPRKAERCPFDDCEMWTIPPWVTTHLAQT